MKDHPTLTRRSFIRTTAAGSVALGWLSAGRAPQVYAAEAAKPALLGGTEAPPMIEAFRTNRIARMTRTGAEARSQNQSGVFAECRAPAAAREALRF